MNITRNNKLIKLLTMLIIAIITVSFSAQVKAVGLMEKITGLKFSIESNKIKIAWNEIEGASGYEIYKSYSKDGSYYSVGKVLTNAYLDTTTYSGQVYYYKVRAYMIGEGGVTYTGEYSDVLQAIYLQKTKLTIKSYKDKAGLKWDKTEGATGYKIYRATSKNGKYERIKTISKQSTTSYTDKKIKSKKVYYYKIRAYRKMNNIELYSPYSNIQEKTKYEQVQIKSSTENSKKKSITLKWQKVSGVTGYKIYRATSKNGKYKHIKTISKNKTTSYTDKKDIGIGKLYYYQIRVYKKSGKKTEYGQYSDRKKQTTGTRKQQMNKIKLKPGTAGSKDLDKEYKKIIKKATKGKKSLYDKVYGCYKYLEENMKHKDGYNCKHFAGTFVGVMKVLGIQNVYCASGETTTTSGGWTAHTWVIMEINDTKYIFDTSIDRHIKDSTGRTSFDRFFKTEKERSKRYKLDYYHTYCFPTILSNGGAYIAVY